MSNRPVDPAAAGAAGRAALGAALLVLCAACSTPAAPPVPKPAEVLQNAGRPVVVVSGSQSGAQVIVEPTQELRVELASNAATVAAGYEWMLVGADPKVLISLGLRFERAPRDVNVFESAGTTLWRFRPQAAGRTTLEFALRKPRSLDAPSETVRYDVTVK